MDQTDEIYVISLQHLLLSEDWDRKEIPFCDLHVCPSSTLNVMPQLTLFHRGIVFIGSYRRCRSILQTLRYFFYGKAHCSLIHPIVCWNCINAERAWSFGRLRIQLPVFYYPSASFHCSPGVSNKTAYTNKKQIQDLLNVIYLDIAEFFFTS